MERICYSCVTPYQIINAVQIQMAVNADISADLFVINEFPNADQVVDRIKDTHLFGKVILIRESDVYKPGEPSKIKMYFRELAAYIHVKKIMRTILEDAYGVCYNTMYISSKSVINRLIAMRFARQYNTKIIYFEDGLGSYFNVRTFETALIDRMTRRLLFGKYAKVTKPKTLFLYSPQLFFDAGINCASDLEVKPIPELTANPDFKKVINHIFAYSEEYTIEEPIIIFDGFYYGNEREQLDDFYQKVAEVAGENNVIIKKHPRDKEAGAPELKYYPYPYVPFELICLNTKIENKLLIAIGTTAVTTPILLFHQEPTILTINHISDLIGDHGDPHYGMFREMYSDQNKVYEADTIENALNYVSSYCDSLR